MQAYQLIFGRNAQRQGEFIGLPLSVLTHAHFKGMTGHGKSNLLAFLAASLILQGVGVALIDPAGELARQVLAILVKKGYYEKYPDAMERVVYLDIPQAHRERRYMAFNILSGDYDPYTAANIVLEGFKRVWPALQDGTSTNIEMLIKLGAYVLAEHKLPLLPYLEEFYTNYEFQLTLLSGVSDVRVSKWFGDLDIAVRPGYVPEIAKTTLKREILLSFSPMLRYCLYQQENVLDVAKLLNTGRSALVSLSLSDPDAKKMLGCLFTEQVEAVAKSRGRLTEEQKKQRYAGLLHLKSARQFTRCMIYSRGSVPAKP